MLNYIKYFPIIILVLSQGISVLADSRREALALFEGVRQNMQKYECFRVCYTETRNETKQTVTQIVDYDHGKIRKEHLQNSEGFLGWVAVVNESDFCSFRRNRDFEDAKFDGPRSLNANMSGLYDPRILWFCEIQGYEATFNSRLATRFSDTEKVQIENIKIGGVLVKKIMCSNETDNTYWEHWISEPQFQVWKIKHDSQMIKFEISSQFEDPRLGPFPSEIQVHRSVHRDGITNVTHDRMIKVTSFEEKKSYPPETFTYHSMDLPLNVAVVDYRISRRLGYWDGEKLVDDPVSVSAQELRELMEPKKRGWINYLFMGIGAAMILWALFRIVRKRDRIT